MLYQALYTFFALAFSEELVKSATFRKIIKETDYAYSWLDVVVVMTIVGTGFGISENLLYSIDSGYIAMLIRAVCIAHGGLGFMMGYFYGKRFKTGKKIYQVLGFLVPWLIHGLYDFSLSKELIAVNENFMFIALILTLVDVVLVVLLIIFVRKTRDKAEYTDSLRGPQENELLF